MSDDHPIDLINSPWHYTRGSMEPIDAIEGLGVAYHEGNVIKYVSRWKYKGGLIDLRKARWYLDRLIENAEREQFENTKRNAE